MESTLSMVKSDGSPVGEIALQASWLEMEKGEQAVHDSVVAYLAARRSGSASTKTRSEVRGTGSKPYRQKGTGRARAGSFQSPIWRGGGITFGPKPRSFGKKVNAKVRRLALKRVFSERVAAGDVIVVDEIAMAQPKTRDMVEFLRTIGAGQHALVVVDQAPGNLLLASRNLPEARVMAAANVNPYWLLWFKKIVFSKDGLAAFVSRFETSKRSVSQ